MKTIAKLLFTTTIIFLVSCNPNKLKFTKNETNNSYNYLIVRNNTEDTLLLLDLDLKNQQIKTKSSEEVIYNIYSDSTEEEGVQLLKIKVYANRNKNSKKIDRVISFHEIKNLFQDFDFYKNINPPGWGFYKSWTIIYNNNNYQIIPFQSGVKDEVKLMNDIINN